jgi:hypothetical protein
MIDEIAKIRGVELHAPTDRGLAMLALRPLSAALDIGRHDVRN